MLEASRLILDAKRAIADEQLKRFLALSQGKCLEETATQLGVTLACVADLLDEGAQMLLSLEPPVIQQPQIVSQEVEASNASSPSENGARTESCFHP